MRKRKQLSTKIGMSGGRNCGICSFLVMLKSCFAPPVVGDILRLPETYKNSLDYRESPQGGAERMLNKK